MAGSMAVGGLMTGFDTKGVVDKLMAVERLAGDRIAKAKTSASALSSAFAQLNGLVKSMGDAATAVLPDNIMKTSIWNSATATSSNKDIATATANGVPMTGSLPFAVDTVARAGAAMSDEIAVADRNTAISTGNWTLSITNHGKAPATPLAFTQDDTLNTVAQKINDTKDLDVSATVVQVRDGVYRLQLTSKSTGADTTLAMSTTGDAGKLTGFNTLKTGQDTRVVVGAGSAAEFAVTSKTTKVDGLMEGVSLTVAKESPRTKDPVTGAVTYDQVTISAAKDPDAIASKVQAMVDAANAALTNVRINSKVDPNLAKSDAGKVAANNSGLFLGNSTASDVTRRISDVFVGSSGTVPSVAGINIARDGTVSFDKAKFTEAYAKDPAAIQKTVTDTAQKLSDVGKSLTNSTDGTLTVAIRGQDALVKDYTAQIKRFEDRMTAKQEILNRQYDALDKMLSKLKSQGDWLTGQLNALNGNSNNKN